MWHIGEHMTTRRDFLAGSALVLAGAGVSAAQTAESVKSLPNAIKPVIVTRQTGDNTIDDAYQMLLDGGDTLDAAHHVCLGRENDPSDHSVGLGGLPNEDGVVELDSSCMHGPTRAAGSVGAVRNIRNVCLLAKLVMQRTAHVMMVGEGAEKLAVAHGMKREELLTEDARKVWLMWKETNSSRDWWGPGMQDPDWKDPNPPDVKPQASQPLHGMLRYGPVPRVPGPEWAGEIARRARRYYELAADYFIPESKRWFAVEQMLWPTTGTIHVSCVNARGEVSGATTTSGLAWKIAGRLGDSPVIGAGCYTDQDVGSAGATGSGEENIKVAGAHSIVELMRQGYSPKEAGLETLRRVVRNYNGNSEKIRYLDMMYYIVRKDGAYAGVSLWSSNSIGKPKIFVVHDGQKRVEPCAYLMEGTYAYWPPF